MAGLQDNTLRMVLVGKTGNGKSATANSILRERVFDSRISAHAVTKSCQKKERAWEGRNLVVVDTPGLFDTKDTLLFTCEEIAKCVLHSSPGPHAIILVVKLGRFTEEEQNTVALVKAVFGEQVMNHMIILFTGKDELKGQDLSAFIAKAPKPLKTVIAESDLRCCAFNNRSADEAEKEGQVQELVELIDAVVRENGGAHFSDPIYKDTAEKQRRLEEAVKKIRADQSVKEKLLREKYFRNKITKEKMEKEKKSLEETSIEKIKKIKEEGENNIFKGLLNKIWSVLSGLWHKFWH